MIILMERLLGSRAHRQLKKKEEIMSVEKSRNIMQLYKDELNDMKSLDTQELLRYLIDMGKQAEEVRDNEKTEVHKIKGCVSNVYIIVEEQDGLCHIRIYSDAMVIKGALAIISKICNVMSIEEVHSYGKKIIEELLDAVDLHLIITPSRTNGFGNSIAYIFEKTAHLLDKNG